MTRTFDLLFPRRLDVAAWRQSERWMNLGRRPPPTAEDPFGVPFTSLFSRKGQLLGGGWFGDLRSEVCHELHGWPATRDSLV
jgi:hypothetical protein